MPAEDASTKRQAAREVIDILHGISSLLVWISLSQSLCPRASLITFQETGLDRTQLSLCVSLLENGVAPDALAVCYHSPEAMVAPPGPVMV